MYGQKLDDFPKFSTKSSGVKVMFGAEGAIDAKSGPIDLEEDASFALFASFTALFASATVLAF